VGIERLDTGSGASTLDWIETPASRRHGTAVFADMGAPEALLFGERFFGTTPLSSPLSTGFAPSPAFVAPERALATYAYAHAAGGASPDGTSQRGWVELRCGLR
jgi:hypothetical protein